MNLGEIEAVAPPTSDAVNVLVSATAFVKLIQAVPLESNADDARLYEAPAADVTATPFTNAMSPEPDGVNAIVSPGARIAAFPAASLRPTLIREPFRPDDPATKVGAVEF
jgi:hypothetical protein